VVKVPRVIVSALVVVNASASVNTVDKLLVVITEVIDLPLVVNVQIPAMFKLSECVQVIPEDAVTFPSLTVTESSPANVPVNPVKFKLLQSCGTLTVQVTDPLAASKNTSSADVGLEAPPEPPEDEDHLVPDVPSQLAVPPTQNLLAIYTTLV